MWNDQLQDLSSLGFSLLGGLGSVLYANHPQTKEAVKRTYSKEMQQNHYRYTAGRY
jgi:hypothetical protein